MDDVHVGSHPPNVSTCLAFNRIDGDGRPPARHHPIPRPEHSVSHPLLRAAILIAALIAPQLVAGQQPPPDRPLAPSLQNSIAALLQHADSLKLALSADQTERLKQLETELDEATSTARSALEESRARSGQARGGRLRALRPHLETIRTETAAVLEVVRGEVLAEEQWEIVEALVDVRRPPGAPGALRRGNR